MTEERIALVEKYLGTNTKPGLLSEAWKQLREALTSYHASLVLEHINHEERAKKLDEASERFAQALFNMQVELYAPSAPEPQEPVIIDPDRNPVDAGYELGGEG